MSSGEDSVSSIAEAIVKVKAQVEISKKNRLDGNIQEVSIVLVSKTKPKSVILEAYSIGGRDFGENYVNELVEKANDPELMELCPDIKWYFIGHLQSNKVNKLLSAPNLYMVQTVDSSKLADILNKAWEKINKPHPLKIMIQVNTSQESNKSGVLIEDTCALVKHILDHCSHLQVEGLMTIGAPDHNLELGPNPEFQSLVKCRDDICKGLGLKHLELSMGMSDDYDHAVEVGSTCIRVGSCIFGSRIPKNPA